MRLRFVDRIVELVPRERILVEKCVSFEEAMLLRPWRARGAPPTLMLEWLGQTAQVLVAESTGYRFAPVVGSFARCEFCTTAHAGERVSVEIHVKSWHEGEALVDGAVCMGDTRLLHIERAACGFLPLDQLWDPAELRAAVRAARGEFPGPVRA